MSVIHKSLNDLSANNRALLDAARRVLSNAYAPYSGYRVGAAVRSKEGKVHVAANLENASYGLSLCAEACALAVANAAGDFQNIAAIAVIGGQEIGSTGALSKQPVTPCGRCRQLIFEAAKVSETNIAVICGVDGSDDILVGTIEDFLPAAFGPMNLGLERTQPASSAGQKQKAAG